MQRLADPSGVMEWLFGQLESSRLLVEQNGWVLREGVKVFVNPRFSCPYCAENEGEKNSWYFTQRIWMIDEKESKLLGVWNLDGSEVPDDQPNYSVQHPHAGKEGSLCRGSTTSVEQLMFRGIKKGTHFRSTELFLLSVGHLCPYIPMGKCKMCQRKHYTCRSKYYGFVYVCSTKCQQEAQGSICDRCGVSIIGEERDFHALNSCQSCFECYSYSCRGCGNRRFSDYMRNILGSYFYCEECEVADNHQLPCGRCMVAFPISQLDYYCRCSGCQDARCHNCTRVRRASELKDNLCILCRPMEEHCQCGNLVRRVGESCSQCYRCWSCGEYIGRYEESLPHDCRKCRPDAWVNIPDGEQHESSNSPDASESDLVPGSGGSRILRPLDIDEGP